jgi:hypothetical protein
MIGARAAKALRQLVDGPRSDHRIRGAGPKTLAALTEASLVQRKSYYTTSGPGGWQYTITPDGRRALAQYDAKRGSQNR